MRLGGEKVIVGGMLGCTLLLPPWASAQPVKKAPLWQAVQPPTQAFPGDEIEMTVLASDLFPESGLWTIGGRSVRRGPAGEDGAYRIAVDLPGDFPSSWDRLPIVYTNPEGTVTYDARLDNRYAVALAEIGDLLPFLERRGRLTGATPEIGPGDRFCVCGFFPAGKREGLRLGSAALGRPLTASGSELWFEVPATLQPGAHEITVDPAAGFAEGDRVTLEMIVDPSPDAPSCPCATRSEFLTAWSPPSQGTDRRPPDTSPPAGSEEAPLLWLESLGGSTGEVMMAHVVSSTGRPVEMSGLFAVEPVSLSPSESSRIRESVRQATGEHIEARVSFYCLQFGAAAPPEGAVYRIAPLQKQVAFEPAGQALAAARRLHEEGRLAPDTNPRSYYHSIRQWAIWTLEQEFNREEFLTAFVEHTRRNAEARGIEWTEGAAQGVRTSAEGRWIDISKILEEAGAGSGAGVR